MNFECRISKETSLFNIGYSMFDIFKIMGIQQ